MLKHLNISCYLFLFVFSLLSCLQAQAQFQAPSDLKVEYLINPIGLDTETPRFSWISIDSRRGARQTAYRVIVSGDEDEVRNGSGSVWDSGKISSSETVNITYEGENLRSNETYFWRVRSWDADGKVSPWSEINSFHMGLLHSEDWQAQWITTPDSSVNSPLIRNEFSLDKEIVSARMYVTGVGYYEAYLNGEKVGDHVLDPGVTEYPDRVLYETYDVTDQLNAGANAVGLWLGNGAWRIKRTEERWSWYDMDNYFGNPMGIVQLYIKFRDGTETIVTTNESWMTSSSPITYNNVYGGEDYDARLEQEGWTEAGFNDDSWQKVEVVEQPGLTLTSQLMPPIRVTETIRPVKQIEVDSATYLFDLGQNIPGWWRIRAEGERGTELTIRGAETLNDSLFPTPLQPGDRLSTQDVYHRDVWTTYVLKGRGTESYEPRFFYTGFRYVEVKVDSPDQLRSLSVEGRVVHSDIPRNGHFSSSDSLLNDIYRATIWSQRGNLHGYPTDCPHREKGGYNGDGQVIAEASMHDFHMQPLYRKWIQDMRDSQYENSRIPNTSPTVLGGMGGGIAWGSAYILIPWWMHEYYDDKEILTEHYDGMKDYLGYLHDLARTDSIPEEPYIINEFGGYWDSLGEWCAPGEDTDSNNPLVNTYYWYLNNKTFAEIAGVLNRPEDREKYLARADSVKKAFNEKFFDPDTRLYGSEEPYQSYLLFALDQNLVPKGYREDVLDQLITDIMVTREGHLGTGILGTKHLFRVLASEGREDVIHTLVTKKTYPSWGYWLENGATTLWERWNGEGSHNHQMFGSVNEYFYKYLAGIRAPSDHGTSVGYEAILIKPYIPDGVDYAEASVETIRGKVSSAWTREVDQLTLKVTLPPNTSGKVSIPTLGWEQVTVTENGRRIWSDGRFVDGIEGVFKGAREDEFITFEVNSGNYEFKLLRIN